jgi:hypothetical protein
MCPRLCTQPDAAGLMSSSFSIGSIMAECCRRTTLRAGGMLHSNAANVQDIEGVSGGP